MEFGCSRIGADDRIDAGARTIERFDITIRGAADKALALVINGGVQLIGRARESSNTVAKIESVMSGVLAD